jgi:hypothetical protein
MSGTKVYTNDTAIDKVAFASSFKGYVYDQTIKAAKEVSSIVTATSNDYVAIYGTKKDGAVTAITFVQTVAEPVTTTVYGSAVWAGSGFQNIEVEGSASLPYTLVSNGVLTTDGMQAKAVDGNNVAIPTADWYYYVGQNFTLTFSKTVLKNGTVEYVLTGVKTDASIKTFTVYTISSNADKTVWTIKENISPSNAGGEYPEYTVNGDAIYVSGSHTLAEEAQFSVNKAEAGNSLTFVYNAAGQVAIVYNNTSLKG